jgi:hypothetical protein
MRASPAPYPAKIHDECEVIVCPIWMWYLSDLFSPIRREIRKVLLDLTEAPYGKTR